MIDSSVLRGFCECGIPIRMRENGEAEHSLGDTPEKIGFLIPHGPIKPVWCLSAKQMTIIKESAEYTEFCNKTPEDWLLSKIDPKWANSLISFFDENPFLVARILKEAKKE